MPCMSSGLWTKRNTIRDVIRRMKISFPAGDREARVPTGLVGEGLVDTSHDEAAFGEMIEHGGKGGAVAAPIAKKIIEIYKKLKEEREANDNV